MASITSPGLGSGLDVNGIVSQLVALEKQPLQRLQSAETNLKSELSTYGKLQSYLSGFRDAASKLTRADTWGAVTAGSSNTAAVAPTASSSAAPGSYSVQVQQLAASQNVVTAAVYPNASELMGQGMLTIQLGTWNKDPADPAIVTGFTAKTGSDPVTVTIGAGSESLAGIRDAINDAEAGVTASIVTDASGARLVLKSTATGEENGFTVSATGDLGALAYDRLDPATPMQLTQAPANALATINGLSVASASNQLTGVVDGLTLQLTQVTAGPVDVTVGEDKAALSKSVEGFVTAYNDLAAFLREQTKYDSATKVAGALQGDRTAVGLQSQLRSLLGSGSTASSVFANLTSIGLEQQRDGTIKINQTKLDSALGNSGEVRKLFAASASATLDTAADGFGQRFRTFTDAFIGSQGPLTTRTDSINRRLTDNRGQQDRFSLRVELFEKRLRAQYSALDQQMGAMNGLSNYVNSFITGLNKSSD